MRCRIIEHTIRANDLARNFGAVLSNVRYRRDSFVVKRNGRPVARVLPIEPEAKQAALGEALTIWCNGAADDSTFADDLDLVNVSDHAPANR